MWISADLGWSRLVSADLGSSRLGSHLLQQLAQREREAGPPGAQVRPGGRQGGWRDEAVRDGAGELDLRGETRRGEDGRSWTGEGAGEVGYGRRGPTPRVHHISRHISADLVARSHVEDGVVPARRHVDELAGPLEALADAQPARSTP